MANTHLIADESIGGIQREYVEVEREAVVGDYVVVTNDWTKRFSVGEIVTPFEADACGIFIKHPKGTNVKNGGARLEHFEYKTLEPTDTVVIDEDGNGIKYRLVDRKAEVGEKVIVVKGSGWYDNKIGSIYPVISGREYGFDSKYDLDEGEVYVENGENESGFCSFVYRENYRALEPITDETHFEVDGRHASPEVIDLLANIASRLTTLEQSVARRVTSLERQVDSLTTQLADTQGNVEKLAEEIASVKHLAESNEGDIAMLDERTSEKHVVINTSNITVNKDADIDAIARALSKRLETEVLAND